jgi:hypothetical protein
MRVPRHLAQAARGVVIILVGCTPSENNFARTAPDPAQPNPLTLTTPIQVDRMVQATIPRVDELFVVDNSCSMAEEQTALGVNFPFMLDWFLASGLDYHVGVVTTDMNDPLQAGRLVVSGGFRWIDETVEGPGELFASMVALGTGGHFDEQGRAAAYTAIELLRDEENAGFVRDDAGMHISVVSDENDASGDLPIGRSEWIDYLRGFRPSERLVSFSSIVGPITGCPDIGSPGTEYTTVTSEVGGVFWPICSEDWTAVLDDLGFLATGLTREFYLSRLPIESTIVVRLTSGPAVIEFERSDWVYVPSRNSVQFVEYLPDPGSVVEVEYAVLSALEGTTASGTVTSAGNSQ